MYVQNVVLYLNSQGDFIYARVCVWGKLLLIFMQTMLPNVSNDSVVINDARMPFAFCCGIGDVGVHPCHQCMLSTPISVFASLVALHVT